MTVNDFATLEEILIALDETEPWTATYRELQRRGVTLMFPSKANYLFDLHKRPRVAWLVGVSETGYTVITREWDATQGGVHIHASDIDNFHDDTEVFNAGVGTQDR